MILNLTKLIFLEGCGAIALVIGGWLIKKSYELDKEYNTTGNCVDLNKAAKYVPIGIALLFTGIACFYIGWYFFTN